MQHFHDETETEHIQIYMSHFFFNGEIRLFVLLNSVAYPTLRTQHRTSSRVSMLTKRSQLNKGPVYNIPYFKPTISVDVVFQHPVALSPVLLFSNIIAVLTCNNFHCSFYIYHYMFRPIRPSSGGHNIHKCAYWN
jgi:hypothetical protein